jgi:DNA-binding transcriptional MocR family regulator
VVEDTAYSALRFEGEALPSLQTLDVERTGTLDASRVILCGTFSKILSPGLRVGWICAAQPIIRRLVLIKQASDLNSSLINQMTIHRMAVESYDSQVARARRHYVRRRDAMLAALERHMPSGASWTKPEGGFFIWVTLPEPIDGAALLRRSLEEAHVAFVPGAAFFADESCRNTIRLSFSLPAEDAIEAGIARLAKLIAQMAG